MSPFVPSLDRRRCLLALAGLSCTRIGHGSPPGFEWRPWPTKKAAPALELDQLDGTRWRLARQRGRVVLVNFWATWCEPCRAEMPSLERLAQREAARGLVVMAANYRESIATVQRFLQGQALRLPVLLDRDGAAASAWTPRIFPSTVVFQRSGRPAGVLVGEIDWEGEAARAIVEPLLAARA